MNLYPCADTREVKTQPMTPELALYTAVVERAILDVRFSKSPVVGDEAWAFLTDRTGNWASSRSTICAMLGIDPDRLRADILKNFEPPELRRARKKKSKPGRPPLRFTSVRSPKSATVN